MKSYIKPYTIEEASEIKRHWAINHLRIGGDYHTFVTKMLPPPTDRLPKYNNNSLAEEHSKHFGTWYEDVEKELQAKERILLKPSSTPKVARKRTY